MPPVGLMCAKIETGTLPEDPADRLEPFALRHRSQISALSAAVQIRRFRRCRITLHLRLKGKVLRRSVELTVKSRRWEDVD